MKILINAVNIRLINSKTQGTFFQKEKGISVLSELTNNRKFGEN